MAEMLGTVIGVVSFGLQVCSGINAYLDAIQCHREDVSSALRLCKSMQANLNQLQTFQERITSSSSKGSEAIEQAMSSATAELSLLRGLIDKLRAVDTPPKSFAEVMKEHKKRILYPFRRDHLERLENRLMGANKAFQTALQVAQMELSLECGDVLQDMQTSFTAARNEIDGKLEDVQRVSLHTQNTMEVLSEDISQMSLDLGGFIPLANDQLATSVTTIASVQKQVQHNALMLSSIQSKLAEPRSDVAELISLLQALKSSETNVILQRLVSKPDALRMVCNEAAVDQTPVFEERISETFESGCGQDTRRDENSVLGMFKCRCPPRRHRKRKKQHFGPAFLVQETVNDRVHLPRCVHATSEARNSWSLVVTGTLFRKICSVAITVTMSASFGSGGLGISPTFTYHPVVTQSPAFSEVETIIKSVSLGDDGFLSVIQRGLKTLQWVFKTRKASPYDINWRSQNLLHRVCLHDDLRPSVDHIIKLAPLVEFLVNAGVPRDRPDESGSLPFHKFASYLYSTIYRSVDLAEQQPAMSEILCLRPDDVTLISDFESRHFSRSGEGSTYFPKATRCKRQLAQLLPEVSQWYGNPLHIAIMRQSESALSEALQWLPPTPDFYEPDTFGLTTWEHLVCWPEGLRITLGRLGNSILQTEPRKYGILDFALFLSRQSCSSPSTEECPQTCACASAVILLLESGCPIFPSNKWTEALYNASVKCQRITIHHLKVRRNQLADIAVSHLCPAEVDRLGLSRPTDTVLDRQTPQVIQALERERIDVPLQLRTQYLKVDTVGIPRAQPEFRLCSIYHYIAFLRLPPHMYVSPLADMFYSHGFHETDEPDAFGWTPSMYAIDPSLFHWLLDHGARLDAEVPGGVRACTTTHMAYGNSQFCAHGCGTTIKLVMKLTSSINHALQDGSFLDHCRCGCSENGCHPYSVLWKEGALVLPEYLPEYDAERRLETLESHIVCMVQIMEPSDIPQALIHAGLRMATFGALCIRHTCCTYSGRPRCDEEEALQLWDEDAAKLERLETLMSEFGEELTRATSSFLTFMEFMRSYWKPRMIDVLNEMEGQPLTEDDFEGIKQLGISLVPG